MQTANELSGGWFTVNKLVVRSNDKTRKTRFMTRNHFDGDAFTAIKHLIVLFYARM